MKGAWRVVVGLLTFWLVVLLYMSTTLFQSGDVTERTERQLNQAMRELELLKTQNAELKSLAQQLKDIKLAASINLPGGHNDEELKQLQKKLDDANKKLGEMDVQQPIHPPAVDRPQAPRGDDTRHHQGEGSVSASLPSLEHEVARRKVETGVKEMWYFIRSQLAELSRDISKSGGKEAAQRVERLLLDGAEHRRILLTDLYNLSVSGGYEQWRRQEAEDLSDLVQARLTYLQNPKDCSTARKLVCNINKGCGYGCQMHHVLYCFLIAYGTQRTMVVESKGWRYSPEGWEKYFLPMSETCNDRSGSSSVTWGAPAATENAQVVDMPIVDSLHPRPPYMPQAIPADLAPRLIRLHGHPFVWWAGQFLKYMLRPQPELASDMDQMRMKLGIKSPIVGVHVRRTDKVGTEAAFHDIDEYMTYVDEYYDLLELRQKVDKRSLYLATDDASLLSEAKTKYPRYEIISENEFSRSAGLSSRYTDSALRAIILDIHFLSLTDYLVCTFSSQVCRIAYEIMQTLHPDASPNFKSLDDVYYFGGQNGHSQMALYPHDPSNPQEIALKPGDHVGIAGNHWDGFSKGVNRRTGQAGLYPSFKVIEDLEVVDMPTYPEVSLRR